MGEMRMIEGERHQSERQRADPDLPQDRGEAGQTHRVPLAQHRPEPEEQRRGEAAQRARQARPGRLHRLRQHQDRDAGEAERQPDQPDRRGAARRGSGIARIVAQIGIV